MDYITHYNYKIQAHLTDGNKTVLLRITDEKAKECHTFPMPVKDAIELFGSISNNLKSMTEGSV